MSETLQHVVVLSIVALCVFFVFWQAFGSFFGRKTRLGKCCDKGCDPAKHAQEPREQFLPVESLSRRL